MVIAYSPVLQAGFIWNDDDYVINNRSLRSVDGLARIWLDPSATPQYYPIVHSTFWLEYQSWGLLNLGVVLVNQEKFSDAVDIIEKISRIDPNQTNAIQNLAYTNHQLGQTEKAEALAAAAQQLQSR